jgi:hypothetical protein
VGVILGIGSSCLAGVNSAHCGSPARGAVGDLEISGEFKGIVTGIINGVGSINRVVYDITSKPTGTIEWE